MLKERSLWPPDWWAARVDPLRLVGSSLWTFHVEGTLVVAPRLVGGSLWTPSGWWAAHCGPSMLKERSLWPPGWWAARCGFLEWTSHLLCDRQVGGKQVAGPLKSLYGDCRP
ncbi:uncharacterized protein LOC143205791 [Rhynchophorus ferrugineus]|uniref:uncharacterized protein LOC143205791 n=1 Tax=Rhynchophorus ferrugineus TaxID=354439 RepID=UPI003FCD28CD